ncbi:MAG: OadG family protein [Gemmatimonadetes bacterium]|jgi:Na+-transporting methylmalonyl-CoA/oxaloacetate decarboxylase gamma subunit|nr:OadG family protein [Gemmatimonadota bacterium]
MENLQFSLQNIIDGQGGGIAITGMSIVFCALGLISLFIFLLPKILERVARLYPESEGHGARPDPRQARDDSELAAAIAFAFHAERQR